LASNEQSTLAYRYRLRAEAESKRRRELRFTSGLILAPVLLMGFYVAFLAAPRYQAEARFSVRSGASSVAGATGPASLLATGANVSSVGGFVDGWAVSDFLVSRDCMHLLDRKIGLRRYLAHAGWDPVHRLSPDASDEQLYQAYLASIDVSFNLMEQIDVMEVRAFSPQDAEAVSNGLLDIAQGFVNDMDDKGVADSMQVGTRALAVAEKKDTEARDRLTRWRVEHGNLDPVAEASMLQTLVLQLEGELNTADISLAKIRSLGNPDHPMLQPTQAQVAALTQLLSATHRRLSGAGETEAGQLNSYEALKNALDFSDQNLNAARQNYQQAFTDTERLRRYLGVVVHPVSERQPSNPRVIVLLLEALAFGFVLAGAGHFLLNFMRATGWYKRNANVAVDA
jgi:capsular polysaccharide transport system permease protein